MMKADCGKLKRSPQLSGYKEILSGLDFMEKYIDDPDIFNPNSSKFKTFLTESFSFLHSDFHYLSFLNKEELDAEILKAAKILQILPVNCSNKLFNNMVEEDIKKFWNKFFSLFKNKKQTDSKTDSIFALSWENKINFFKDIRSTINYLSYEFPVVCVNKLTVSDVNEEIDNWKELNIKIDTCQEESTIDCDEELVIDVDSKKLITDLQQVISMYLNKKTIQKQKNQEPEYADFFKDFVYLTENISRFKKNINVVNSNILQNLNFDVFLNDINMSETFYFLKRCNNFIINVKSKHH